MGSLDIDLFVWTPIIKGYATLKEMQEYYTLEDVFDMNLAISLQNKVEERSRVKES